MNTKTIKSKTSFISAKRILFIGDSITDCGRREPDGAPLGKGYVKWLHHILFLRQPQREVLFINRGIGGNTAEDLWSRWEEDVIAEKPDALCIKIGINDCHRYVNSAEGNPRQSPDSYEAYLRDCLLSTRSKLGEIPILLAAPFYLGSSTDSTQYRGKIVALLPEYIAKMQTLAKNFDTDFLDCKEAFAMVLRIYPPSVFSNDMVHLNEPGAIALAELFYQKLFSEK